MADIDKNWALNQLRHRKNAFLLSMASAALLNSDSLMTLSGQVVLIKGGNFIFFPEPHERTGKRLEFPFDQLITSFQHDRANYLVDIEEFLKSCRRNLIKETFEVVRSYAEANDLKDAFHAQPWHRYARIIRNAVTHDLHFKFDRHDLAHLPIVWAGETITLDHDGSELTKNFVNPQIAFELLDEACRFIVEN